MKKLRVIDFFCGGGGFSEGFRQMGFEIVKGYDNWKPAIDTFNHNFGTESTIKNILDFETSIEDIESLPDTEVIIGSPPCVSFSSSNKSGKADKSLGLKLTEAFLKIVTVKKHQPNSILEAWFMENVVNSKKHLKPYYSFEDLGLEEWANKYNLKPSDIAIQLEDNSEVINSADFGSMQKRKRLISGEIINKQKFINPDPSHKSPKKEGALPNYNTVKRMKQAMPHPYSKKQNSTIKDPQFDIEINFNELTDHFYDTGIYEVDAKFSKHWKVNHPFMGKMAFPENDDKPSRTITAVRISNSRESIIYKSEIKRKGDGEYRQPTVREAAVLMGFPITFQFMGSEYTKWRLVGNAVCSSVSRALAKTVLKELNLNIPKKPIISKEIKLSGIQNLNTFQRLEFTDPPVKKEGAKCRWHPFKYGNMTVTLSNYRIDEDKKSQDRWFTSIQYGTGDGFPSQLIQDNYYLDLRNLISEFKEGVKFLKYINNGFTEKIGPKEDLQRLFELQTESDGKKDPTELVEELKDLIESLKIKDEIIEQDNFEIFQHKDKIPLKQLLALYGINKISTIANKN